MNPMAAISPGAGTALGGAAGGMLGTVGGLLSLPRRAAWSMLGSPFGIPEEAMETGSSLLGHFGMDEESPWTQALGLGLEVAGDPLTYMGGLLGRAGSMMARGGMADDLARQVAQRQAAQQALVRHSVAAPDPAQYTQRIMGLGDMLDPQQLAAMGPQGQGLAKNFARPHPGLAGQLERAGMGTMNAGGDMTLNAGFHPHFDKGMMGYANRAGGMRVPNAKGELFPYMQSSSGKGGYTLAPGSQPMPTSYAAPGELDMIRNVGREMMPSIPGQSATSPKWQAARMMGLNNDDILAESARRLLPTNPPPMPMVGGLPADQAFQQAQQNIANLLAQIDRSNVQAGFIDRALTYGGVGAAGGIGFGVGMNAWGE